MRMISASRFVPTVVFAGLATVAGAATITNNDSVAIILSVTESGNRSEIAIEPGTTEQLCSSGCFVTFPNGDRLTLGGSEAMKIVNGTAVDR